MKKDYFEYIMDYAAGELPPEHEDELFLAMQGDPELRDQFRDYLTLRRAASGASAHFAPPASSTMKIMNELGISAGAAGSSWAIGRFFSANRNMLIGSLAAAAITSMLFLLFYNPSREAIEKQEYASTQPISAQSFTEENPGNKYVDINSERKASKAIPTPEKSENIYIVQNHNNNEVNDQEIGDEEIAYNRIAEKSIGFMPENEQSALRLIKNDNAAEFDDVNEIEYEKPLRIDLFATGSIAGAFFLPPHTDNSADALSFADYDAGLFWKVSDGFAIGFEARREYFTQPTDSYVYDEFSEDRKAMDVYGIALRFFNNTSHLFPYGEFAIGTARGPVLRVETGLGYHLNNKFAITAGMKYTHMFYDYGGSLHHSKKLSLGLDLIYNFSL